MRTLTRQTCLAEVAPSAPKTFQDLPVIEQIKTKIAHWEDRIAAQDRVEAHRRESQVEPETKKRQTTLEQSFATVPNVVTEPSLPPPCLGTNTSRKEFQHRKNEEVSKTSGGTGST